MEKIYFKNNLLENEDNNVRLISLFLNYCPYFTKFHELINWLESNLCIVSNSLEPDHFIHVIGRNWSNYIFFFLVVPYLLILLKLALIHFVKQSKRSWLIDLLSFLALLGINFWLLVCWWFFFLVFRIGCNVDFIRIIFSLFRVYWFETSLNE